MPSKCELSDREGNCASPVSHRDEFPAEYSLAGCSPAEPASAFPASLILLSWASFAYQIPANSKLHISSVSQKRAHPSSFTFVHLHESCTVSHKEQHGVGQTLLAICHLTPINQYNLREIGFDPQNRPAHCASSPMANASSFSRASANPPNWLRSAIGADDVLRARPRKTTVCSTAGRLTT
jgi:hypothetical protein